MDILILADDLSGACDCAGAAGSGGLVLLSAARPDDDSARVVAVDLDTRLAGPKEAAARTAAAAPALRRPGVRLYLKIDSTLRGNWAVTVAALRGAVAANQPAPLAIVCPALPEAGRTVLDGRLRVGGSLLEETAFAEGRANAGDIGKALAATGLRTAAVSCGGDADTRRHAMQVAAASGAEVMVCDAVSRSDLERIAQASLALDRPCIWVGSAGLMGALASSLGLSTLPADDVAGVAARGPVLTVVGSAAAVSRAQVDRLSAWGVECVLVGAAALRAGAITAPPASMVEGLAQGRHMALTIAPDEAIDVADGPVLSAALAALAAPLVGAAAGLVLTGGETARAVLGRAGVIGIRIVGAVEPAVPLGITLGALRKPIVTKAGAFGDADTLVRAVSRLSPATAVPL